MKNIEYINRYRDKIVLKHTGRNTFELVSPEGNMRIGYNSQEEFEKGNFNFIDPSGGPFLQVGGLLSDKKHEIVSIHFDKTYSKYIIKTKTV